MKMLLLVVLLAVASSQQEHRVGQVITVECIDKPTPIYLKWMRDFTLVLLDSNLPANFVAKLESKDKQPCNMTSMTPVCHYTDGMRQLSVRCTQKQNINVQIVKTIVIGQDFKDNASFIQLPNDNFTRGIVSVLINGDLTDVVKQYLNDPNLATRVFLVSTCVRNIALFQDHFRIAVRTTGTPCIIGLRNNNEARWSYKQSTERINSINDKLTDYCEAQDTLLYSLPTRQNYTLQLLVETDLQKVLDTLELRVIFSGNDKVEQFLLKNFEKGVNPFFSKVFTNLSASELRIISNIDVFIKFSLSNSTMDIIVVEQEEYLFGKGTSINRFILELDNFDDPESLKKVQVFFSKEVPSKTLLEYANCEDEDCKKYGMLQPIDNQQFSPDCTKVVQQLCYLLFKITNATEQKIGVIFHVPMKSHSLDPGMYHHGTLPKDSISKYVVDGTMLSKAKPDSITIYVEGAHAYLTYDPECRRVACTQFEVRDGFRQIPNERKNLYVILEGTAKFKYQFMVDLKNDNYELADGYIIRSSLAEDTNRAYFVFNLKDGNKSLDINCNSAHGKLVLLARIGGGKFPELGDKTSLVSYDGFISIPANTVEEPDKVYITVVRQPKQKGVIRFGLVAMTEGTAVHGDVGNPYYDYILPNGTKLIMFTMYRGSTFYNGISIKIDVAQDVNGIQQLEIQVGNGTHYPIQFIEWDLKTLHLTKSQILSLCPEVEQKDPKVANNQVCSIYIRVHNAEKVPVEFDILLWVSQLPVLLFDGVFINFDMGALGEQTHFYIEVAETDKPISLYAYSTMTPIDTLAVLYIPASNNTELWPFPKIDDAQNMTTQYSSAYYFAPKILKEAAKENQRLLILLTIRDRSKKIKHQELDTNGHTIKPRGSVQVAYSTGKLLLKEDDKFEYYLLKKDKMTFEFPLEMYLASSEKESKQQIYLYNTRLLGTGNITLTHYVSVNNEPINRTIQSETKSIVPISLDNLSKAIKQEGLNGQPMLVIVVESEDAEGRFIVSISTSFSEYRQLALGVPEEFIINKNSSVVFQFSDVYNTEFRVKINRKQGFPDYKIVSCKDEEMTIDCIKQLEFNRSMGDSDPDRVIVAGRSHQLTINHRSQQFCKSCRYYLALYAFGQVVQGSLTVTRGSQAVILREDSPVTTEVYNKQADLYRVSVLPEQQSTIMVTPHTGSVKATLMTQRNVDGENRLVVDEEVVVKEGTTEIDIPASANGQFSSKLLSITSNDGINALYTVRYVSGDNSIVLADGMPVTISDEQPTNRTFKYDGIEQATLIIASNTSLKINLTCLNQIENKEGATLKDRKLVYVSTISNVSTLDLSPDSCQEYMIAVLNTASAHYSVVVSGSDIMMLPMNNVIPGRLRKGEVRGYEVPIAQAMHIKIIMKMCEKGRTSVGLTYDKSELSSEDYQQSFEITQEQDYNVYNFRARPGILYILVKSVSKNIEYALEAFSFKQKSDMVETVAHLEHNHIEAEFLGILNVDNDTSVDSKAKKIINKALDFSGDYEYQFEFYSLDIESHTNYAVQYYLIESLSKGAIQKRARCQGLPFGDPENQVKEELLKIENVSNSKLRLKARYKSKHPYSFATIIPVINPKLPSYITYEPYKVVQLTGGSKGVLGHLSMFWNNIYSIMEDGTPFKSSLVLNILTGIVVIIIFLIVYTTLLAVVAFITYSVRTSVYRDRSRPLASSEFESRTTLRQNDNTLDMIERQPPAEVVDQPEPSQPESAVQLV